MFLQFMKLQEAKDFITAICNEHPNEFISFKSNEFEGCNIVTAIKYDGNSYLIRTNCGDISPFDINSEDSITIANNIKKWFVQQKAAQIPSIPQT